MKKIAGITWWKNNYGSILQAYALEKVIDDMEIVEYEILQQFSANAFSISTFFLMKASLPFLMDFLTNVIYHHKYSRGINQ